MFNNRFLKKINILFIESNKEDRDYFSNILDKFFNKIIFCLNAREGIKFFERKENISIDIIICNQNLNDLTGIDVLKQIRKNDEQIPFIIYSEIVEPSDVLIAIKYKVTDYFEKPLNIKDLIFCIEKVCHRRYKKNLKASLQMDLEDLKTVINEVSLVVKTDNKCNIIYVNNYICEVSGFKKEELLGNNYQILNDENNFIFEEIQEKVNAGIIWEGKLKNKSKEKEEFYLYLTVLPIYNKTNSQIIEFIWISFLTTDEELEEKKFKKNIEKNMYSNRRINIAAREKIDKLMAQINEYRAFKSSFLLEKQKTSRINNQIIFYEKELFYLQQKIDEIREKVSLKIKPILEKEKEVKEQKEKKLLTLNDLNRELINKNETIEELKENILIQLEIIRQLSTNNNEIN